MILLIFVFVRRCGFYCYKWSRIFKDVSELCSRGEVFDFVFFVYYLECLFVLEKEELFGISFLYMCKMKFFNYLVI